VSEKSEKPSAKRLREERKKGNLARSKPLAAAFAALVGFAALVASLPSAAAELEGYARQAIIEAGANATPIALACGRAWQVLAIVCLPVLCGAFLGATAGAGLQVGVLFNAGAIGFKPEKLSPAAGLGRIFSTKNLLNIAKAALAASAVLFLTWAAARDSAGLLGRLPLADAVLSWNALFQVVRGLAFRALGFALAFGALDYLLERRTHLKGLMMSRDELKREHKESEGDPRHKSKRKALHKALLNGTAARGVQKASVVILNPTHVAVALRYDPAESSAPTIVAKGVDEEAAKVRWLARRFSVPMVRDIPLARALVVYDLGEEIPEELYQAAAVVLRKVYEMGALPFPNRSAP
jgi:type III secretion protein U